MIRDDRVDALLYAFMKIVESKILPKHPTRKYRVIYSGHPLVTRLCYAIRRVIRIRPWVEAFYQDECDPIYMRDNNTMYVGPRTYQKLKANMPIKLP